MANPRAESVALVAKVTAAGHDPANVEQLMLDISGIADDAAFAQLCAFTSKLANTANVRAAIAAADGEVEKQPRKIKVR